MDKLEVRIEQDLQGLLSNYIKDPEITYDHSFDYDYEIILEKITTLIKRFVPKE